MNKPTNGSEQQFTISRNNLPVETRSWTPNTIVQGLELVSYPWLDNGKVLVNARAIPGDPTTMHTYEWDGQMLTGYGDTEPSNPTPKYAFGLKMYGNFQFSLTSTQQSAIQVWLRTLHPSAVNSVIGGDLVFRLLHSLTYAESWSTEPKYATMKG